MTIETKTVADSTNATLASICADNPEIQAQLQAMVTAAMEQGKAAVAPAPTSRRRTIKKTDKGGLYVRDPEFVAFSTRLSKKYVAGLNVIPEVATVLFRLDKDGAASPLLTEVCEFVRVNF